ncbi:MAG: DNA polymerase III subunit delta [Desulfobacterales bacterium]
MAEIHYTDITGHVRSCRKNGFAQIYLIYGDPYLQQQAGEAVVAELLPDPDLRSVYLETVDAEDSSGASDAVERAGTYSFFSGPKVVVFKAGDLAKKGADHAEILKSAIRRGFPKNHYLIVKADNVDKRTGLYKAIKNSGTVVDCSVPSGTRKAERETQRRILQFLAKQSLAGYDKSLDNEAFAKIYDLVGPEPGSFVAALGKLALFAEGRARITKDDVEAVLAQSREDPVYLFTNALGEKNADLALYYLDSLIATGFYYAQLLSAMANQIRRLSAVKGFVYKSGARLWEPGMPFERFKKQVMPAVVEHDRAVSNFAEKVSQSLQTGASTEMVLAKNPNNPFPVYQNFIQADNFSPEQLDEAICALHRADVELKTTGPSPRYVIESVIIEICGNPGV